MDTLPLPPRPDLEQYRKRAKELVKVAASTEPDAVRAWATDWLETLARLRGEKVTPFVQESFDRAVDRLVEGARERATGAAVGRLVLADAQFLVARAHGFANWSDFTDPFVTWRTEVCSPSGISAVGSRVWVGALRGESLWSVKIRGKNRGRKVRHFHGTFGRIRTVAKAPDGSLWITTSNRDGRGDPARPDDRVIRITL